MLPTSRNTTYVAGVSEVKSADLNDIQDKIIDAETDRLRERSITYPASLAVGVNTSFDSNSWETTVTTATSKAMIPISIPAGSLISSIEFYVYSDNANATICGLAYADSADGTRTTITTENDTTTGIHTITITFGTPHEVIAGRSYSVYMQGATGSTLDRIAGAKVVYNESP